MIVFVDDENRIKAVGTTDNPDLKEVMIADDELNPFTNWSVAKICACKIIVDAEGHVIDLNSCLPTSSLDYIDEVGHKADDNADKAQAFDIMIGGAE